MNTSLENIFIGTTVKTKLRFFLLRITNFAYWIMEVFLVVHLHQLLQGDFIQHFTLHVERRKEQLKNLFCRNYRSGRFCLSSCFVGDSLLYPPGKVAG